MDSGPCPPSACLSAVWLGRLGIRVPARTFCMALPSLMCASAMCQLLVG